ncbi:16S rRNA (guanine(966)-N(2))-methyltransferase RsmD [Nitratidesulfovibrio vulgaris]|jgi:16S rRNA (guanine966-N2)-methyltransferase|uniref:Methyltransferase, putative n=2 Tax=Nitratidesulfovibrio vulgaris TaxID=881 RepID=Q72BV3_NITV2|nr:16S rRNA (guanine(966)-N(2))-methyltransferase RsmD [Nitratidesulfovibrio vulgaris]GEB79260.1 methyltransferase [Desulfovibrio desulfuricans]HBW16775.1 16S rRNA (guanine(966)-N(2))-methyltransferase RsmD [Desulfovibrio sp.]AAS96009.1 methyltransferase, putative [Nitratidesulfovibrio vulgaris str. Hildenborough]ABM28617.1 putative methyltransferase [Nitratidesulfovibrio vulgaris DP4]ADP86914.1 methyltransferase [Nitratidesulfovibrio vulgaris RCH1]
MRIIAGAYGGRLLKTVEGPGYRPAMSRVRESLFSMLSSRGVVWAGSRVLDLFAGSGSLAFEALSRGADEAWFVELNAKAAACIEKNATSLGIEPQRWRVLAEDITKVLGRRAAAPFDVVFIDPPYGEGRLAPTIRLMMRSRWLAPEGVVVAEVEAGLAFDAETVHDGLEVIADRTYGQTRIVIWTTKEAS